MEFITLVFTSLIAFFGILAGALLSHFSEDEVHAFKKYIPMLQMVGYVLTFLVLFIFFNVWIMLALLVMTFLFVYVFWHKHDLNVLDYVPLASLFVLSSLNPRAHFFITAIVFVFGVLAGALFYAMNTIPASKTHGGTHHHKHSGKHLPLNELLSQLFVKYVFFFLICILVFVVAEGISQLI